MSTPSTITAIVQPPHSGHYSYQYPAQFVYSAQPSPNESTFSKSSRPPPSASYSNYAGYKQSPRNSVATTRPPPSQPPSTQPTPTMSGTKAARRPDWNKFFENGPPKEIIVIEDTPEPDGHDQPSRPPARVPHTQAYATHEPASKKRRTDNAYEAAPARTNPSYSVNRTPHCHGSGSETISTDRTTSLNTTAPTSLGSNGSSRSYVEASAAGQKRKRVTRQSTSDQKKREQLACQDTQSRYIPPATIFRQKEEVRVRVVKDVRLLVHYIMHKGTLTYYRPQRVIRMARWTIKMAITPSVKAPGSPIDVRIPGLHTSLHHAYKLRHDTKAFGSRHFWQGRTGTRSRCRADGRHQGYSIRSEVP